MTKERDASLSYRFFMGILGTVTASAVIAGAGTVIQLGNDWTKLTTVVEGLANRLEEKTSDLWTKSDHQTYSRAQTERDEEQNRRIERNETDIGAIRNRR